MGQTKTRASEAGFTVVEVVIAAAVMFFVLTAVIGLLGASSNMTVQAKQRAVMTNAVSNYVDTLRQSPWDSIESSSVVVVVNNITVSMSVNVELRQEDGQDIIKVIRISAVSTLNGKSQMYETSVALLRNPNFNRTLQTDPDAPVVYFMSEAPDDDEVVWADQQDSGPIFLRTKAFSPVDKVKEVTYDITGRATMDPLAVYTPDPTVQSYYSAPTLNTLAENIGDGFQTVSVMVTDEMQRIGTMKRRFIVDNVAPSNPGTPTVNTNDPFLLVIDWAAAPDGGTLESPNFASHYECQVSMEPTQGQPSTAPDALVLNEPRWLAGNNLALAVANDGPIYYEATLASATVDLAQRAVPPFSRFETRVRSSSPRGLTTGTWVEQVSRTVTRPELVCDKGLGGYRSTCLTRIWGVGSAKETEYTLHLYLTRAGFQRGSGDNPTWEIQYQSAATTPTPEGWLTFTTAPSLLDYDGRVLHLYSTRRIPGITDGRSMYFRIKVSGYRALRDGGAIVPMMYTNSAGPSLVGSADGVLTYLTTRWEF